MPRSTVALPLKLLRFTAVLAHVAFTDAEMP